LKVAFYPPKDDAEERKKKTKLHIFDE